MDLIVKGGQEDPQILRWVEEPTIDPDKYPILARSWESRIPAYQVEIGLPDGKTNWQQIFRQPFAYRIDGSDMGEQARKAWERLLASLEHCLCDGLPSYERETFPIGTVGGVKHFLGRGLQEDDEIALMPLQEPVLLLMRGEGDLYNDYVHHGEWLCETSLWVKAGS